MTTTARPDDTPRRRRARELADAHGHTYEETRDDDGADGADELRDVFASSAAASRLTCLQEERRLRVPVYQGHQAIYELTWCYGEKWSVLIARRPDDGSEEAVSVHIMPDPHDRRPRNVRYLTGLITTAGLEAMADDRRRTGT